MGALDGGRRATRDMTLATVVVFNAAWPTAAHPTLTEVVLVGGDPSARRRGFG
jgi:hypothetical protein